MTEMSRRVVLDTDYPAIRRIMGRQRETLDDSQLEALLAEAFPGADPEDVEDFMRSVQQFGKQVAPVAQKALPGVIQGATTGAAVGGPWGAAAGAVGGGAASLLAPAGPRQAPKPRAPRPGITGPVLPPPSAAPGAPVVGPAPAAAQVPPPSAAPGAPVVGPAPAAAQLMALLSRPETMHAMLALVLGNLGRNTVVVGQRPIPAAEFANAVAEFAAEAVTQVEPSAETPLPEHLVDERGLARGDIVNPAERAALLATDLFAVAAEEAESETPSWYWRGGSSQAVSEEDWVESYEMALAGRQT